MTHQDRKPDRVATPASHTAHRDQIVHILCPACDFQKAVVAATHYSQAMCFCPACEHVWDCDAPPRDD